jgi:hypothetical protein
MAPKSVKKLSVGAPGKSWPHPSAAGQTASTLPVCSSLHQSTDPFRLRGFEHKITYREQSPEKAAAEKKRQDMR